MQRLLRPHRYQPQGADRYRLEIDRQHPLSVGLIAAFVPVAWITPGETILSGSNNANVPQTIGRWGIAYAASRVEYLSSFNTQSMTVVGRPSISSSPAGNYNAIGVNYYNNTADNFVFGFGFGGTANTYTIWARSNTTGYNGTGATFTQAGVFENHFCATVSGWGTAQLYLDASASTTLNTSTVGVYANDSRKRLTVDNLQRLYYGFVYNRAISRAEDMQIMLNPWQVFRKREIWVPRQRIISLPALSLPTYTPGSLTGVGFRPRVTAS